MKQETKELLALEAVLKKKFYYENTLKLCNMDAHHVSDDVVPTAVTSTPSLLIVSDPTDRFFETVNDSDHYILALDPHDGFFQSVKHYSEYSRLNVDRPKDTAWIHWVAHLVVTIPLDESTYRTELNQDNKIVMRVYDTTDDRTKRRNISFCLFDFARFIE